MAEHTSNELKNLTTMEGKGSPFGVSYGKLMIWFFLVTDALTFGGFLVSYGVSRYAHGNAWPIAEENFVKIPFFSGDYPLGYVAFMTFVLIISSVTMVLAVEAGHRMSRKGVTTWFGLTVLGGLIFLGSQAWEWSHFIHGTEFGAVELSDGSHAIVKGEFGKVNSFEVVRPAVGSQYATGDVITDDNISAEEHGLVHAFQAAAKHRRLAGTGDALMITLGDGTVAKVNKDADIDLQLLIKQPGNEHAATSPSDDNTRIFENEGSKALYYEALTHGRVIYGANLRENEYGPQIYAQYFFWITGFHGFHVTIGVLINIIIFLNILKGTYERRGHYEMIEKTGLYWHFVDLVWVFVFTFLYLV